MKREYFVEYRPILSGTERRYFSSRQEAKTWCRQIGRKDLIERICSIPKGRRITDYLV